MKKNLFMVVIFGLAGVVIYSGCAPRPRMVTAPAPAPVGPIGQIFIIEGPKEYPDWIDRADARSTKTHKAFSGESLKHATRSEAKRAAEKSAKLKALEALWGESIDIAAKEVFVSAGLTTDILAAETAEKIKQERRAKGIIRGDFVDYCIQKVEEVDEFGNRQIYWRAFALYMVDRNLVKEYLSEALAASKKAALDEERKRQIDRGLELIDKIMENW